MSERSAMNQPEWHDLGALRSVTDYCWPIEDNGWACVVARVRGPDYGALVCRAGADAGTILLIAGASDELLPDPEIPVVTLAARPRSDSEPWRKTIWHGVRWAREMVN